MYNTNIPTRAELPTSAQLFRSTAIAAGVAVGILVTIVLPSEYAIDPTGVGRALGLTQMGETKAQLAAEAAADAAAAQKDAQASVRPTVRPELPHDHTSPGSHSHDASAVPSAVQPEPAAQPSVAADRSDNVSLLLRPGQGAEVKMTMKAGAKAYFDWTANGAVVNFDAHGDGEGRSISYKKGRQVGGDTGVIQAAFNGYHGWYWRNRGTKDVTMTLRTQGNYTEIKRVE
ncbi:hypothetical protein TK49_22565 [Ralstonia mannitolilytica]|uniref:hypothetical protein n=1 Tax=Ralstonia mannitolilytica TaxID=105219 RepID=UPI0005D98BD0|nr:hypothetical protein [Ralstonia mannitolilytica]AJW47407.1 hypothetical protein TK49_22565 [Ralstonia mannitolilytica]